MHQKRRQHPNSLKNLRPPVRPGEVLNPTGINRKRPYTDRLLDQGEARLPDEIRQKINQAFEKQIGKKDTLPAGATYADAEVLRIHLNVILRGDVASAAFISDRIEGKPPNRLDLVGHERQEITFKVVHEQPPPYRDRIEGVLFRDIVALIQNAQDSEDEHFLTVAASLAELIKQRAAQRGKPIDVAAR